MISISFIIKTLVVAILINKRVVAAKRMLYVGGEVYGAS
jgi:hypothetical protein